MSAKYLFLFVIVIVPFLCIISCSKSTMSEEEAKRIIQEFSADNVPESIIDQPLLKAGKPIVPYVAAAITNKNMPRRVYAIGALGKIGDPRALPILEKILEDTKESIEFRGNALSAIWHINKKLGEQYAIKYAGDRGYFDRTIELLKKGLI